MLIIHSNLVFGLLLGLWSFVVVVDSKRLEASKVVVDEDTTTTSSSLGNRKLDQLILDDLIAQESLCVGQDCVNGETFNFDTLRLKENNLRIHFQDTSTSASFPSNDWRIVINDSANGGRNFFGIDDVDGQGLVVTINAGAPNDSIVVAEKTGNVGFGTSNPQADVHAVSDLCPTLRLERSASGGILGQTWDIKIVDDELQFVSNGVVVARFANSAPADSLVVPPTTRRSMEEEDEEKELGRDDEEEATDHNGIHHMSSSISGTVSKEAFEVGNGIVRVTLPGSPIVGGRYHVMLTVHTLDPTVVAVANIYKQDASGFSIVLAGEQSMVEKVSWMVQPFPSEKIM